MPPPHPYPALALPFLFKARSPNTHPRSLYSRYSLSSYILTNNGAIIEQLNAGDTGPIDLAIPIASGIGANSRHTRPTNHAPELTYPRCISPPPV
jgi:hypothetical protein